MTEPMQPGKKPMVAGFAALRPVCGPAGSAARAGRLRVNLFPSAQLDRQQFDENAEFAKQAVESVFCIRRAGSSLI